MPTPENYRLALTLVRDANSDDVTGYVDQISNILETTNYSLRQLRDAAVRQIDIAEQTLDTGEVFRGDTEEGQIEITPDNAPDILEEGLFMLVAVTAFSHLILPDALINVSNDRNYLDAVETFISKLPETKRNIIANYYMEQEEPAEEPDEEPAEEPAEEPTLEYDDEYEGIITDEDMEKLFADDPKSRKNYTDGQIEAYKEQITDWGDRAITSINYMVEDIYKLIKNNREGIKKQLSHKYNIILGDNPEKGSMNLDTLLNNQDINPGHIYGHLSETFNILKNDTKGFAEVVKLLRAIMRADDLPQPEFPYPPRFIVLDDHVYDIWNAEFPLALNRRQQLFEFLRIWAMIIATLYKSNGNIGKLSEDLNVMHSPGTIDVIYESFIDKVVNGPMQVEIVTILNKIGSNKVISDINKEVENKQIRIRLANRNKEIEKYRPIKFKGWK